MENQESLKVTRSVVLDSEVLSKVQKIAERRDRSTHYILVELIEKNVDKPEHATEPTSEA